MGFVDEFFVPVEVGEKRKHTMWILNPKLKFSFKRERDAVTLYLAVLEYWHPRLRKLFCKHNFWVYPEGKLPNVAEDTRTFFFESPVWSSTDDSLLQSIGEMVDGKCETCVRMNTIMRMIFESPRIFCRYPFVQQENERAWIVHIGLMRNFAQHGFESTRRLAEAQRKYFHRLDRSPYRWDIRRSRWRTLSPVQKRGENDMPPFLLRPPPKYR